MASTKRIPALVLQADKTRISMFLSCLADLTPANKSSFRSHYLATLTALSQTLHLKTGSFCAKSNDLTIEWQNLNPLSHPHATLAQQARASGENLNYLTLALQARQARASFGILNYLLSH